MKPMPWDRITYPEPSEIQLTKINESLFKFGLEDFKTEILIERSEMYPIDTMRIFVRSDDYKHVSYLDRAIVLTRVIKNALEPDQINLVVTPLLKNEEF